MKKSVEDQLTVEERELANAPAPTYDRKQRALMAFGFFAAWVLVSQKVCKFLLGKAVENMSAAMEKPTENGPVTGNEIRTMEFWVRTPQPSGLADADLDVVISDPIADPEDAEQPEVPSEDETA
jgi:hypothetical protein